MSFSRPTPRMRSMPWPVSIYLARPGFGMVVRDIDAPVGACSLTTHG
jgi:hypothetical protein